MELDKSNFEFLISLLFSVSSVPPWFYLPKCDSPFLSLRLKDGTKVETMSQIFNLS